MIGLNPGAAFGAAKHWPAEHFAAPGPRVWRDGRGCGVLVLCGPSERDMARRDRCGLADRPARAFAWPTRRCRSGLTKACVRRLDLLVTTDSGPRHFAAAFDRPVVSLFGPTHIAWTETYFAKAINLQKQVPCGPCQLRVCPLDHRCMRDLSPRSEVFDAAVRLLTRFPLERHRSECASCRVKSHRSACGFSASANGSNDPHSHSARARLRGLGRRPSFFTSPAKLSSGHPDRHVLRVDSAGFPQVYLKRQHRTVHTSGRLKHGVSRFRLVVALRCVKRTFFENWNADGLAMPAMGRRLAKTATWPGIPDGGRVRGLGRNSAAAP